MQLFRLFLLVVSSFVFIACSTTSIRHTKDYGLSLKGEASNVVVLPPEAKVFEIDLGGKQKRLYDFEYNIEAIIADKIIPALSDKGIHARLVTRKDIHDQKIQEIVGRAEDNFSELEGKLYKTELLEEKQAFNINDNMNMSLMELSQKNNNAKLVVMISYSRSIKTSGSQAFGFVTAALLGARSEPADQSRLRIAIIEASTGKILWVNRLGFVHSVYFSSDDKKGEQKYMKEALEKLLSQLKF